MDINFNDIMDSVSELADSTVKLAKHVAQKTGKKTEEIVGTSKAKLDMMKLESEIKTVKQQLGGAVYEMTEQGCTDTQVIDQYVAEIKMKYAQLEQLKEQVDASKKTVLCPECKASNAKESFFCTRCGAALPTHEAEYAKAEDVTVEEEQPEDIPNVEEIFEQAKTDGADDETAANVAEDAEKAAEKPAE